MKQENVKTLSPEAASQRYGIPRGSLANMRFKGIGPKFYKAGKRRVLYAVEDFEKWLFENPVQTIDSIER
jgi:hypothetical protein